MKTKIFLFGTALAYIIVNLAVTGCTNNSSAQNVSCANCTSNGDTLVLNLYDTLHNVIWYDTVTGRPVDSIGGGYWSGTFDENEGDIQFCDFVFPHAGAMYIGGGDTIRYWGGFTTGSNGDTGDYGRPDTAGHIGSVKWIDNQWGVMAGGGFDSLCNFPVKGTPYLIAYGSQLDVRLVGDTLFKPVGVYICNHPWPYYGNIHGDGFARPLDSVGDYFRLKIYGVIGNTEIPITEYDLAENPTGTSLIQSDAWKWINLSITDSIQALRFKLETTDTGDWGPNTALYFCMNKLTVVKTHTAASVPATRQAQAHESLFREFSDNLPLQSHKGGEAVIHDEKGNIVLKTTLKAGRNTINTSKLPTGKYLLKHNGRHIPLKK
jgi:hypothetical protein